MVLVTTSVGFYLGAQGPPDWLRLLQTLLGTALASGGTIALNQFLEREVDARMERTRRRPLPEGRLRPAEALSFGSAITGAGLLVLLGAGLLPCLVTAATVGLYLFAYTPLKRRSALCLIVGAVPGALPPVIGWVAAGGELGSGVGVLFGILFLWQLPHTLAIATLYREDYARGGIRLLPATNPAGAERQTVVGSLALLLVGLLPTWIGLTGQLYLAGALALGMGLLGCGIVQAFAPSHEAARRVLGASLLYLPTLLILMTLDKA
ncbi:MAG: protoheme IX farnesyltransferase [Candidatus Rokubacteria bacterium]|nr:protoheme IX farnesyltransferase [Candidatus Rokubacteria bacterium]